MIIGIYGHQGSGKSEVASMLKKQWEPLVDILPFSAPIKEIAKIVFGVEDYEKNTSFVKVGGMILLKRELYQKLGEGMKSIFSQNIWLNIWEEHFRKDALTIVPDLRFKSELTMLQYKKALIVKIEKEGVEGINLSHPSEKEWPSFVPDIVINNNSSKEALYEEIRSKIFPRIPKKIFIDFPGFEKVSEEVIIKEPSDYCVYISK